MSGMQPRQLGSVLPPLVYAMLLLFPIAHVAWDGSTLTGIAEESVGYRYFYPLRTLWEPHYLFLPQGEIVNLLFKGVHLLLSAIGYPTGQLFPRIDVFSYAGVALLHLLTVGCFWWGTLPMGLWSRVAAAFLWASLYYLPGTSGAYIVIQPDYMLLLPGASLILVGFILRIRVAFDWTAGLAVSLAAFVAASLAIKITVGIMPAIALLHALFMSRRRLSGLACCILAGSIGIAGWIALLLLDLRGSPRYVAVHFWHLLGFMKAPSIVVREQLTWPNWMWLRITTSPILTSMIYAQTLIGLAALTLARRRWEVSALASILAGMAAYGVFLFQRDYPVTIVECLFPLAALVTVTSQFEVMTPISAAKWTVTGAFAGLILWTYPSGVGSIIAAAAANTRDQAELRRVQAQVPGKILWLVETNEFRPFSVDSGIMKGGSGDAKIWIDPPSEIMATISPKMDFRFGTRQPVAIQGYAAVMFAYGVDEDLAGRVRRLGEAYAVALPAWACRKATTVGAVPVALCLPPG